jgi:hypothetical protein
MKWKLILVIMAMGLVLAVGTVRADQSLWIDENGNITGDQASAWTVSPFGGFGDLGGGGIQIVRPDYQYSFDDSVVGVVSGIYEDASQTVLSDVFACMDNSPNTLIFVSGDGTAVGVPYAADIPPDALAAAADFVNYPVVEGPVPAGPGDELLSGWGVTFVVPFANPELGVLNVTVLSEVPEPSTLVLLGMGAISLVVYGWRKRK